MISIEESVRSLNLEKIFRLSPMFSYCPIVIEVLPCSRRFAELSARANTIEEILDLGGLRARVCDKRPAGFATKPGVKVRFGSWGPS